MSLRLVVVEGGVGHRSAAAQDGAARQHERRIRVPRLRGDGRGTEEHAEGESGGERDAHPAQTSRRGGAPATGPARGTPPRARRATPPPLFSPPPDRAGAAPGLAGGGGAA